ncbi:hypothetical protein QWY28_14525 [Nocardioides sp. SOB77]|uniref:Uncharacterized protein n=1 Tax=Nocardioides oceani TaxID=3058369 RepID=A0ABT8FI21_9ACTN|nr:hypothetical protein [Nocardioides oceani]MDN4174175.1 hypothetical protein [Nocardioides oceani]
MLRTLAAATATTALLALAASPAHAATLRLDDPEGDAGGAKRLDVVGVTIRNDDDRVVVRVAFAEERNGDLIVSIDPRGARGLRLVAEKRGEPGGDGAIGQQVLPGAFTDTTTGPSPVTCDSYRLTWAGDVARMVMPSDCLHDGDYGAIRVAVLTENGADSDYAPGEQGATRWIARG